MSKDGLIHALIRGKYLETPRIIEAFKSIDRKDFIPQDLLDSAYVDEPLPIGFGQTISQPLTVAFMLEHLSPEPGDKILDVGAGSGWQSALLAEVVGDKGKVISIERIPELVEMAKENIAKYNFIGKNIVEVIEGDGSEGCEKFATYDKIIAAASARELPPVWKEQLKVGGKIVAPVEHSVIVVNKVSDNKFDTKEYFGFSFVPLVKDVG
ncbi:protein-L-isoaspartate O-methyltransferase [Candidatus Nomurabacteria bacterium RIFCSPLOWO2_02_FULL_40_10]|uniref:Protein-L-isoaspartate O-methyltransferase n=1 Tax=Candidatus Nomurabacteria bacterium RIFCSPLOWO2_02_FULL_40_10 TaxID=1801786 RepID=A0A1F6Y0T3_9BACT|nr:MAG: protein-L-isoaspartate O-methyltransferase [Candidatus Nomurabacteria bacterium RIFCSPLOWO2_02_FULL_40_10]